MFICTHSSALESQNGTVTKAQFYIQRRISEEQRAIAEWSESTTRYVTFHLKWRESKRSVATHCVVCFLHWCFLSCPIWTVFKQGPTRVVLGRSSYTRKNEELLNEHRLIALSREITLLTKQRVKPEKPVSFDCRGRVFLQTKDSRNNGSPHYLHLAIF